MAAKKPECSWGDPDPRVVVHTMASSTTVVPLAVPEGEEPRQPVEALVTTWCTRCGTLGSEKVVPL